MAFVAPRDLHSGPHLSGVTWLSQACCPSPRALGRASALALSRLGTVLCPESSRICSSHSLGPLLTCHFLSDAFCDHLTYSIFLPQHSLPPWTASCFFFWFFFFFWFYFLSTFYVLTNCVVLVYFLSSARTYCHEGRHFCVSLTAVSPAPKPMAGTSQDFHNKHLWNEWREDLAANS